MARGKKVEGEKEKEKKEEMGQPAEGKTFTRFS